MILPAVLQDALAVLVSLEDAAVELEQLMDRLRNADDDRRVAALQTALNRLEESARIVRAAFD